MNEAERDRNKIFRRVSFKVMEIAGKSAAKLHNFK